VIALRHRSHGGAQLAHDPGAFVSENQRRADAPVSARGMEIAVAHAGRFHLDEHFAGAWGIEFRRFDGQRLARVPEDGGFDLHYVQVRSMKYEDRIRPQYDAEQILITRACMTTPTPDDLAERSFRFTCDVYDYCEDLVRLRGLPCRIAYQLFDSAGSVGANRAEAKSAYTNREFAAKNAIALRESREARFWLRVATAERLGDRSRRDRLLREVHELISIYASIVRTLKTRGHSGGSKREA
jgi:four helix bundle protein